jgi:hypothetical protein
MRSGWSMQPRYVTVYEAKIAGKEVRTYAEPAAASLSNLGTKRSTEGRLPGNKVVPFNLIALTVRGRGPTAKYITAVPGS